MAVAAPHARAGDWPMWRYDAGRTACSPDALPARLHLCWQRQLAEPRPAWPPTQRKLRFDRSYEPVVMGHTIFVPSMVRDRVTAYDTETGDERWRFYTDGPVRFAPIAHEGRLYVVSDDGCLYCLDAATGELRWKFRGGPSDKRLLGNERLVSAWPARGAPVLVDGVIYVGASVWPFMGTFIYALDAATGEVVWTNSGSGSIWVLQQHHSPAFAGVAPQGYLAVTGDVLLVSGGRTVPAGYDRHTGKFLHFNVSDRAFGKDAGGYGVYARGKWYFNGVAMYRAADGAGVVRARASVLTDDAMIAMRGKGKLIAHALRLEHEEYIDRKGKPQKRVIVPELWEAELDPPLDRICIKAGPRLYGCGADGLIAAVDVPGTGARAAVTWQTRVDGDAWSMIAGDDKLFVVTEQGRLYCFGAEAGDVIEHGLAADATAGHGVSDTSMARAREVLDRTGVNEGYAVVLGIGDDDFAEALTRQSELQVIVLNPDTARVDALRRRLDDAGLYGTRVTVLPGDVMSVELPPYLARLLVADDAGAAGLAEGPAFVRRVFRVLRPYGGTACLRLPPGVAGKPFDQNVADAGLARAELRTEGPWTLLERVGPLPGAGAWTHQYGDAGNSVVSPDRIARAPMSLLWFGGPSNAKILPRHGHGPAPQVVGGRLFIEGPGVLRAIDVYTGRLLWERSLPGVGRHYDYTSHEPGANILGSNYVSLIDGIYVVYENRCLRLDPATGETQSELRLPVAPGESGPAEWGYLGISGDLLVAGASPMSFFDPDFDAGEFHKANDRQVAALVNAIRGWTGFDRVPRADCQDDRDFIVRNLNLMLDEPELEARIPAEVRARGDRDQKWATRVAELLDQLRRCREQDGPGQAARRRELNRALLEQYYSLPHKSRPAPGRHGLERSASRRLVAMNRNTGDVLWTFDARHALRHNAIAIGGGKVFCIDRLPAPVIERLKRRGMTADPDAKLVALDARTGEEVWSTGERVFGTWLGYSSEYDLLVQAGSAGRDRARDEVKQGMVVYHAADGEVAWQSDAGYGGPVMLHHDTIIAQSKAFDLNTGEPKGRRHPLTGREIPWRYARQYGCATAVASEHLLTFRSAAAGFYDLDASCGTGNFGGFKTGCTSNLIAADGLLNAPDYTRTCTCSYQNQSSLALVHDPDAEMWTFSAIKPDDAPVRRVGINLGAPGDRWADNGTLWLDYPSVGGPSPDIPVRTDPPEPDWFRGHASQLGGDGYPWVQASGVRALRSVTLTLAGPGEAPRRYTVCLYFAEPEPGVAGGNVFDVAIQGRLVLRGFDPVREAGAGRRGIVRTFKGVDVGDDLTVTLTPADAADEAEPLLCGIEVLAEGW